ncbi:hypothetical protein IWQ62_000207 [Dispira parvispora]|uniref:Elongation factor 1-gamma n=1 Tax=Dispira parvispora TaxID=1520584 RepID=A0A9W8E593_9FUNG|nr:hypothetical protein IWQ62_000207 [Dispira parvispora]
MASAGKLYGPLVNFRNYKARVAAEYNGIKIDVTPEAGKELLSSPEYLANFPYGKAPGFVTADGKSIIESNAIAYYLAGLKQDSQLLGKNHWENSEIMQFVLFSETEVLAPLISWFKPILGSIAPNKVVINQAKEDLVRAFTYLNNVLLSRTFLVGERVTLADIVMTCNLVVGYKRVFSPEFRSQFKNLNRYFLTCVNQPQFAKVIGAVTLMDKEPTFAPLKKDDKKAKKAPAAPKAAKPAAAAVEAAPAEEPKPKAKNPLDLLPPTPFNLEEWKRFYSNNDTKPTAMDYFWKNYDPQGWSIWKVSFKYNSELTLTFMSNNQIGGFFARLERARKYAFGTLLVLGENNNNEIQGYFVIRGQEVPFEIYDAADYDSYEFVKVDPTNPATKEEIGDYFAWEGPSLPKPCADGKVFK